MESRDYSDRESGWCSTVRRMDITGNDGFMFSADGIVPAWNPATPLVIKAISHPVRDDRRCIIV